MSKIRQSYNEETEGFMNKQINIELNGSYAYLILSAYFDRDNVALDGTSKYFKELSDKKMVGVHKLMAYQNLRGGRIVLSDVKPPTVDEWATHEDALAHNLKCEKGSNASLLTLHKIGDQHNDAHLCDFLEREFLGEKVKIINELSKLLTNKKRAGPSLGVYQFEKHSMY